MGVLHPGNLRQQLDRERRLQRQAAHQSPLSQSSVHRGGVLIKSPEGILVETVDGGQAGMRVTGLQVVDGTLRITGTLEVDGQVVGSGTFTFDGPAVFKNTVELRNLLTVLGAGKIKAGNITIDPTVSGGAIVFQNGAQVFTDASTIQVYKGNSVVQISDDYAKLQYGGNVIQIDQNGVLLSGLPTITRANANNAVVGTLFQNPAGRVFRVVN